MKNIEAHILLNFLTSPESAFLECTLADNIKIQNNIKVLTEYVNTLNDIKLNFLKPTEETITYDKERLILLDPYLQSITQPNGEKHYLQNNNAFQIVPGSEQIVDDLMQEFNLKHKDLISKLNVKKQDWVKFYTEDEATLTIEYLNIDNITLPEKINKASYEALQLMLEKD